MTAGDIYTAAGTGLRGEGDNGPALRAQFSVPLAVAVDAAGNLVIGDTGNLRIRVVAARTGRFYGQAMTAGDVYSIAGNGAFGASGDGGPATRADLEPIAITLDAAGNVLVATGARPKVRVVAVKTGMFYGRPMKAGDIYAIAGDGAVGFAGDGGPALDASMFSPSGVAVDSAGNVLVSDAWRIRVVAARTGRFYGRAMTAGDIYTVAGNGTAGFSGDGGPGTAAELNLPMTVAVDGNGNVVIADTINSAIRVLAVRTGRFYGQPMTAGDIYTVAGTGSPGFSGDGGPATSAHLAEPRAVAIDGNGSLVIADTLNSRIRIAAA